MEDTNHKPGLLHILNIVVVFGMLLAGGILYFFIPQKTVSEIEKRKLTLAPNLTNKTLWNGTYTREIEAWYADHFPYRDHWISFASSLREYRGFLPTDQAKIVTTVRPDFLPDEKLIVDKTDTSNTDDTLIKTQHSLFIYKGKAFQLFGSSAKVAGIYAAKINYFQAALGDSIKFYNLLVPSSTEMYLPEKYLKMARSEKANIQLIYSNLNAAICKADAYSKLYEHKDEYLYFGTDHHWTALGAYYAYQAFAECAGFTPMALESLEKRTINNFLGTLYALSLDKELAKNPDHVDYYKIPGKYTVTVNSGSNENNWTKGWLLAEGAKGSNGYGVFLGADYPVMKIQNANENGRRILVLKESFGNAFVPFLVPHFETVYVADIRYFRFALLDFIQKNKINEVLVINGTFMANNPYFPNKIKSMMYKANAPLTAKKKE